MIGVSDQPATVYFVASLNAAYNQAGGAVACHNTKVELAAARFPANVLPSAYLITIFFLPTTGMSAMQLNDEILEVRRLDVISRELDLREQEIRIKSQELATKSTAKSRWFSSPVTLAAIGTISGLFATALSLYLQSLSNNALEEKKMEYSLIQNALADGNKKQAIRNLKFLKEIGLVKHKYLAKIDDISRNSEMAPSFVGAVIRDEIISISEAKRMLKLEGAYDGKEDDVDDRRFRNAIARFQMKRGKLPDGLLGPCTLRELWITAAGVNTFPKEGRSAAISSTKDECK